MTDSTEIRIIAVRPNGTAYQSDNPGYAKGCRWFLPVVYVLEDGTEQTGSCGPHSRKRDAIEYSAPREGITNMTATYRDGQFVGTRTTYGIGR